MPLKHFIKRAFLINMLWFNAHSKNRTVNSSFFRKHNDNAFTKELSCSFNKVIGSSLGQSLWRCSWPPSIIKISPYIRSLNFVPNVHIIHRVFRKLLIFLTLTGLFNNFIMIRTLTTLNQLHQEFSFALSTICYFIKYI